MVGRYLRPSKAKRSSLYISPLYMFGLESYKVPRGWVVHAKDT
jgi:hypothetical protein